MVTFGFPLKRPMTCTRFQGWYRKIKGGLGTLANVGSQWEQEEGTGGCHRDDMLLLDSNFIPKRTLVIQGKAATASSSHRTARATLSKSSVLISSK
jgi:hypothetical protein